MKPGYDWFYPYYRDRALVPGAGRDSVRNAAARRGRGGRSQLRRAADAVALGIQAAERGHAVLVAPGPKFCMRWDARRPGDISRSIRKPRKKVDGDYRQFKDVTFHGDEVTYVSLGDGTTSEGEFWESAECGVEPAAADCFSGRGQRVRDFGARRSADRRRKYFAAGVRLPQFSF